MTQIVRLEHLVYTSQASTPMDEDALGALVRQSRTLNHLERVSGILLSDGQYFLQLIEARTTVLDDLWARLLRDPRHRDVTLVTREPIEARNFADWGMNTAYVTPGRQAALAALVARLPDT